MRKYDYTRIIFGFWHIYLDYIHKKGSSDKEAVEIFLLERLHKIIVNLKN